MDTAKALHHLLLQKVKSCEQECPGEVLSAIRRTLQVRLQEGQYRLTAQSAEGDSFQYDVEAKEFGFYLRSSEAATGLARRNNWDSAGRCLDGLVAVMTGTPCHCFSANKYLATYPSVLRQADEPVRLIWIAGALLAGWLCGALLWGWGAGLVVLMTSIPLIVLGQCFARKPTWPSLSKFDGGLIVIGTLVGTAGSESLFPAMAFTVLALYCFLESLEDLSSIKWGLAGLVSAAPAMLAPVIGLTFSVCLALMVIVSAVLTPWRLSMRSALQYTVPLVLVSILFLTSCDQTVCLAVDQLVSILTLIGGASVVGCWWMYGRTPTLAYLGALVVIVVTLLVGIVVESIGYAGLGSAIGLVFVSGRRIVHEMISQYD